MTPGTITFKKVVSKRWYRGLKYLAMEPIALFLGQYEPSHNRSLHGPDRQVLHKAGNNKMDHYWDLEFTAGLYQKLRVNSVNLDVLCQDKSRGLTNEAARQHWEAEELPPTINPSNNHHCLEVSSDESCCTSPISTMSDLSNIEDLDERYILAGLLEKTVTLY